MPGADVLQVAIEAKAYGGRRVLERVRFSARPGEVLALLAPSGTGKTTALRIIVGLDRDFRGSVVRPWGRIGTVFQEPRLLPWMDVAANLRLVEPALTDRGVADLLAMVGLQDCAEKLPKSLSLGMARRVALARALAVQPRLLVMDEPFASLDARLAAQLGREVTVHARRAGAIVVLATHDLDQALAIADRVLVLEGHSPAVLGADLPVPGLLAPALRERYPFLGS